MSRWDQVVALGHMQRLFLRVFPRFLLPSLLGACGQIDTVLESGSAQDAAQDSLGAAECPPGAHCVPDASNDDASNDASTGADAGCAGWATCKCGVPVCVGGTWSCSGSCADAGDAGCTGAGCGADGGDAGCGPASCGSKVCGRSSCGYLCGTCPNPTSQSGCFVGQCSTSCPGTPAPELSGQMICEGEMGAVACAGGTLGYQVCQATGGGPGSWTGCGPCM